MNIGEQHIPADAVLSELKTLFKIYGDANVAMDNEHENRLYGLVSTMESFVQLYRQKQELKQKMAILSIKINAFDDGENDECDCGE